VGDWAGLDEACNDEAQGESHQGFSTDTAQRIHELWEDA
jgi:hypothetical protein